MWGFEHRVSIALTLAVCACVPDPKSVRERRAEFDRSGLEGRYVIESIPEDASPVQAVFGNSFELAAVRLTPATPKRGDEVEVEYFWRVLEPSAQDFRVFIHGDALDGDSRRIHGDHWPANGRYPTGVWQKGEIIRDAFRIRVPSSYGPSRLGLYSGLYRGDDRLDLTSKGRKTATSDDRSLAVEIRL